MEPFKNILRGPTFRGQKILRTELRDVSLCKSNSLLVVTVIGRYSITTNVVSVITASELLPLVQKLIDQN